jgi:hypothetical protein
MRCKLMFGLPLVHHSIAVYKFSKNLEAALKFCAPDYDMNLPYCGPKITTRHLKKLSSHGDLVTGICASLPDYITFYLRMP